MFPMSTYFIISYYKSIKVTQTQASLFLRLRDIFQTWVNSDPVNPISWVCDQSDDISDEY